MSEAIAGKKVLAAVLTFNRLELLKRCLAYLREQTYPLEILVINNSSTDGTEAFLQSAGFDYITQKNTGASGGWHRAIAETSKRGYDFVWLMDDDGFPDRNALEILMNTFDENTACVSSVVIKEDKPNEFVFGFPKLNKFGNPVIFDFKRKFYYLPELYPRYKTYSFAHLFNGALIDMKVVQKIGNVNTDYFIYGEELDFLHRLGQVGKVISAFTARHYHPDVSKRSLEDKKVYYYIRNTIIVNRRYMDKAEIRNWLAIMVALYRVYKRNGLKNCLSYLFGENKKYFYPAIKDGYNGKFIKRFQND